MDSTFSNRVDENAGDLFKNDLKLKFSLREQKDPLTNVNTFKCNLCHKCFPDSSQCNMRTHLRIHTYQKPFECNVCHKLFVTRSNMTIHLRIHTKHKPFEFTEASKTTGGSPTSPKCVTSPGTLPVTEASTTTAGSSTSPNCVTSPGTPPVTEASTTTAGSSTSPNCVTSPGTPTVTEASTSTAVCNFARYTTSHGGFTTTAGSSTSPNCVTLPGTLLFSRQDELKQHVKDSHSRDIHKYQCAHCNQAFTRKDNLGRHLRIHNSMIYFAFQVCKMASSSLLICRICGNKFSHRWSLVRHEKAHTSDTHSCDECAKVFKSKEALSRHKRNHATPGNFLCSKCGLVFQRKDKLSDHEKTHTGTMYSCSQCVKQFSRPHTLQRHVKNSHSRDIHKYQCGHCDQTFTRKDNLGRHLKIHNSSGDAFSCARCDRHFARIDTLAKHAEVCEAVTAPHARETEQRSTAVSAALGSSTQVITTLNKRLRSRLQCEICNSTFSQKSHLLRHVKSQHKKEHFSCAQCGKSWSRKVKLNKHSCPSAPGPAVTPSPMSNTERSKISRDIHKYQCGHCDQTFTRKHNLGRHLKIHNSSGDAFSCARCDRHFARIDTLAKHAEVCEAVTAPHARETEQRSTAVSAALGSSTQVITTLNIERLRSRLQCEICNSTFSQKSHLLRHVKSQHKKEHFSCAQCGKSWSRKVKLNKHSCPSAPGPAVTPSPMSNTERSKKQSVNT
ncbi:Zinc finger protein 16 [Nymphon striatum]|nr:Zinc finger protein 16 [Nymphon striatum]